MVLTRHHIGASDVPWRGPHLLLIAQKIGGETRNGRGLADVSGCGSSCEAGVCAINGEKDAQKSPKKEADTLNIRAGTPRKR